MSILEQNPGVWFDPGLDGQSDDWVQLLGGFEVRLARAVLQNDPEHVSALQMLGGSLTRLGRHEEALGVDRRLVRLMPSDPVAHYNLACSQSNLGHVDEAFRSLDRALDLGYRDFRFLREDPDLENVRRDPRFKDFLSRAVKLAKDDPPAGRRE
jgi:tetratricopeptide (TPR) repeat protein